MFDRIRNSWSLVKASAGVLSADKELILFPIISGIVTFIVTLTFIVPSIFAGVFDSITDNGIPLLGYVVGFLFYVVQYFVIFFFNTALVGAAMIRLRGGDPTVGDGLRIAGSHFGSILAYALIAATVGMLLKSIRERAGVVGQIVVGLLGFAWNIATYLVVPVLVVEGVGPVAAIKRSAALLRQTWGEQIAGNIGIGLIFFLLSLPIILVGAAGIFAGISAQSPLLIITVVLVFGMALVALGLINSTLNGIYQAALYHYVADEGGNPFFDESLMANAFKPKR